MINTPFGRASLNVQDGVVDCNKPTLSLYSGGSNGLSLGSSGAHNFFSVNPSSVALYVNVDEKGQEAVVIKEQGYEWMPVYTRKLT